MMTWEYSPEFAIRTYAFIIPFVPYCWVLRAMGCSKITLFFGVKLLLGQLYAWAASRFLDAVERLCGREIMSHTMVLMLSSPGVFFSSTAFLPSAVCSSLVMTAVGSWVACNDPYRDLTGYFQAIFSGCLAVFVSGW